ncbi:MAG TPA: glycosyltransferase family 4 protein [Longimicrobium sp.]|nr:glycosyltransferase family 4 protein [Longimicrobium sp.]
MRIVFSNPRRSWGGASTMVEVLARGLAARGHAVVVFTRPGSRLYQALHADLPCEPILHGVDFPPATIARCLRAFRRHRTQVVVSSILTDSRLTVPAARLAGIPVVARRVGVDPFGGGWVQGMYDRMVHVYVANSLATRRAMLDSAPWLDPSRVELVYNGVDAAGIAATPPARLGLPPDALAVGFVGRLDPQKGADLLPELWERVQAAHPHAHLVIAGAGSCEAGMRERFGASDRVHWLGFRRDAHAVVRALDVLLVPSRTEAFGLAGAEAMAAGVPVVASTAGGLPEVVVDGKTGLLVPPEDLNATAAAVLRLAGDAGLRARLGRAGREHVLRRFTLDATLNGYESLLERLVARRR